MTLGPCPRCSNELVAGVGVLGEAACVKCHARWLDHSVVEQVREVWLRIAPDLFAEMARAGAAGAAAPKCPHCRSDLRVQRLRGVEVDLCAGCGGMLLDPGELLALSRGQADETRATSAPGIGDGGAFGRAAGPSLEVAHKPRAESTHIPQWGVYCVQCESELDFHVDNYIVGDRPWCGPCVRASGLVGLRGFIGIVLGAVNMLFLRPLAFISDGLFFHGTRAPRRRWRRQRDWLERDMRRDDHDHERFVSGDIGDDAVIEKVPAGDGAAFARFASRAPVVRTTS